MKVERVREKDGKLELMAELSGAEVAQELNEIAQAEIAKNEYDFDYNGDQSAVAFLRERLGNDEAAFVLDEALMRKRASFALTAAQVDIIGSPVYRCLEHATEGKPFEYHMVVVLVPEMELESYDPVSITVPSYTVKKDEVDEEIERMVKASSINVPDETHETVVKGDKVELKVYRYYDAEGNLTGNYEELYFSIRLELLD